MKKAPKMGKENKRVKKRGKVEISPSFVGDRGGRRSRIDRRRFLYTHHIPERRSGKDRRKFMDRRSEIDYKMILKRRKAKERRAAFLRLRDYAEAGDSDTNLTEGDDSENTNRITHSNEHQES